MIGDLKVAAWSVLILLVLVAAYRASFGKQLTI